MSDLVERLRNKDWLWTVPGALREEAAVEIEKLRAALCNDVLPITASFKTEDGIRLHQKLKALAKEGK